MYKKWFLPHFVSWTRIESLWEEWIWEQIPVMSTLNRQLSRCKGGQNRVPTSYMLDKWATSSTLCTCIRVRGGLLGLPVLPRSRLSRQEKKSLEALLCYLCTCVTRLLSTGDKGLHLDQWLKGEQEKPLGFLFSTVLGETPSRRGKPTNVSCHLGLPVPSVTGYSMEIASMQSERVSGGLSRAGKGLGLWGHRILCLALVSGPFEDSVIEPWNAGSHFLEKSSLSLS